jgi:hypothetical protein
MKFSLFFAITTACIAIFSHFVARGTYFSSKKALESGNEIENPFTRRFLLIRMFSTNSKNIIFNDKDLLSSISGLGASSLLSNGFSGNTGGTSASGSFN